MNLMTGPVLTPEAGECKDMCQWCGEILDGDGFPQICAGCQESENVDQFGQQRKPKPKKIIKCDAGCNKMFASEYALSEHRKDKHGYLRL